MRHLLLAALPIVVLAVTGCGDRDAVPSVSRTPEPSRTAPTASPASPTPGLPATYRPQLSYIDEHQTLWLVDIESGQRTELLQGCSGTPAPKAGELTSGTWWSANGERVACVTAAGDIIGARADGSERATLVKRECQYSLNVGWAPTGDWFACTADRELILAEPSGRPRARIGLSFTGYNVWSTAPDGQSLFVMGEPVAGHGSWVFYDSRGRSLGTVPDAYAGRPVDLAWEPSGKAIAYPGFDGLTIVDLPSFQKRSFKIPGVTAQQWGSGPDLHWIDEQTLVLITLEGQFFTMDALSGKLLQQLTFNAYAATRVPNSRDLALFTWGGTDVSLERIDPLTGTIEAMATLPAQGGIGPLPLVTFSGDGARLCVMYADPEPLPTCGDAGDDLAALPSKLTIEVGILGADRFDRFWQPLSPDLTRVAAVDADGTLTVSVLDGSNPMSIGSTPGPLTYEWRPDGLLRRWAGP